MRNYVGNMAIRKDEATSKGVYIKCYACGEEKFVECVVWSHGKRGLVTGGIPLLCGKCVVPKEYEEYLYHCDIDECRDSKPLRMKDPKWVKHKREVIKRYSIAFREYYS